MPDDYPARHGTGPDRLLVGVELADGWVATSDGHGWPPDLAADAPSLTQGGGSGGDRSVDLHRAGSGRPHQPQAHRWIEAEAA